MSIGLTHYLLLAAVLFAIGMFGVLSKRNIIAVMMGIELIHAAQAVDLRGKPALGRVTGPVFDAFRKEVPFLDADRNLSIDIEKAYHFIADGRLDAAIRQADAN